MLNNPVMQLFFFAFLGSDKFLNPRKKQFFYVSGPITKKHFWMCVFF